MSVQKREWPGGDGKKRVAYRVRWKDEAGSWQSRSFDRERDALNFDADVRLKKQRGTLGQLNAGTETLDAYTADTWIPTFAVVLSERTRRDYRKLYEKYLGPELGRVPLRDLTPERIQRWQAEWIKAGAGPTRVRKALALLSSILQRATEAERIHRNPASLVRPPKPRERAKVRPLVPASVEALRAAMLEPAPIRVAAASASQRPRAAYDVAMPGTPQGRLRDATLVSVLAYAGLRPGEALALRWGDVGEGTLNVERAVSLGAVKATKTGATRSVRLLEPLAADLREFRMASGRPPATALVFPSALGAPWSEAAWGNWTRREWTRALEGAELARARPYDLRHSFASLLLHEGRSVPYVAAQLGHGAVMTLRVYGHVVPEFDNAPRLDPVTAIVQARAAVAQQLPKTTREAV